MRRHSTYPINCIQECVEETAVDAVVGRVVEVISLIERDRLRIHDRVGEFEVEVRLSASLRDWNRCLGAIDEGRRRMRSLRDERCHVLEEEIEILLRVVIALFKNAQGIVRLRRDCRRDLIQCLDAVGRNGLVTLAQVVEWHIRSRQRPNLGRSGVFSHPVEGHLSIGRREEGPRFDVVDVFLHILRNMIPRPTRS